MLTWKIKVTKYSRSLFRLQAKTLATGGIESGLPVNLKTPCASEGIGGAKTAPKYWEADAPKIKLRDQIAYYGKQLLPTPCANKTTPQTRVDFTPNLAARIQMLPTPATRDYKGANGEAHMVKDRPHLDQLPNAITHGTNTGTKLRLEPAFVEWMMHLPLGWTDLNVENQIEWQGSKLLETRSSGMLPLR